MTKKPKTKIIILMEKGIIQDIQNIPDDIEIEVKDAKTGWVKSSIYTNASAK